MPPEVLIAYLDYDVVRQVSQRINLAQTLNLDIQPETNEEKKILKLGWLINNIKSNGVNTPIQLIKSGQKYFCHPGTDKILVTSYIIPTEIEGFYLWYKDLDESPFVLGYQHRIITNFLDFTNLFIKNKTLKFYIRNITEKLDISDNEGLDISSNKGNAYFGVIKNCFLKSKQRFNYYFITYFDNMHWVETDKMKLSDIIHFINDSECVYGGVKFLKKNKDWIPDDN